LDSSACASGSRQEVPMVLYVLGGVVSLALFVYLFVAMLKPEHF
jgi:K+-transporting ATPase KdpF subunit